MEKLNAFKQSDDHASFRDGLLALVEAPPTIDHVYCMSGNTSQRGFIVANCPLTISRYELLKLYFPCDTAEAAITALQSSCYYRLMSLSIVLGDVSPE